MLSKKYEECNQLYDYLKLESEDDIVKHGVFLKMVDKININELERIAAEQEILNEEIPFEVKYSENYLWQIYYSDITKQYFMMVTLEDEEFEAFFYLLKKQIEAYKENKDIYIYVPVCNTEYSGELLTRNEIADTENYIWLFTKDWPFVYEVYDKNGIMNVYIIGNTICYEKINSHYKIVIKKPCRKNMKLMVDGKEVCSFLCNTRSRTGRPRRFCCEKCRREWWKAHLMKKKSKKTFLHACM